MKTNALAIIMLVMLSIASLGLERMSSEEEPTAPIAQEMHHLDEALKEFNEEPVEELPNKPAITR